MHSRTQQRVTDSRPPFWERGSKSRSNAGTSRRLASTSGTPRARKPLRVADSRSGFDGPRFYAPQQRWKVRTSRLTPPCVLTIQITASPRLAPVLLGARLYEPQQRGNARTSRLTPPRVLPIRIPASHKLAPVLLGARLQEPQQSPEPWPGGPCDNSPRPRPWVGVLGWF